MRQPLAPVLLLLALLSAALPALRAGPWYSTVPVTSGATIYASVQGGTQTVLVGGAGLVVTSANRRDWTRRTSGTTVNLFGVAYGAGRFVAVGEAGTILSSTDGIAWTTERHPYVTSLAPDINGITFANGRFVAVSRSFAFNTTENVITSTDGRTWTRQTVDRGGFQLQSVAYANGQYVAIGGGVIMVSADALSWRTVWTGGYWLYGVVRGPSRWVVAGGDGNLLTSADGSTWTETPLGQRGTLNAIAYRNGRFLGVGSNPYTIPGNTASVFASTDGLAWTALPFPETASITRRDSITSLLATETGFLGFGAGGLIAETTDGTAWTVLSQPANRPHFFDVAYGNGLFVAVGDQGLNIEVPGINQGRSGAIYTSWDGWNWQPQASRVTGSVLTKIAYGGGRFVAVGTGGVILYSDDGATWTRAVHTVFQSWQGVAYGAGKFVAVGSVTMTSPDGVIWTAQPIDPTTTYSGVRFAHDSFFRSLSVFTGPVQRSTDGVTWTTVSLATAATLKDVSFYNGLWIAATGAGVSTFEGTTRIVTGDLQVSTDGNQWTALRTPTAGALYCVQRLGDRWVAGAYDGTILTSIDGRNWQFDERPTDNTINRFAATAEYAVAVGSAGALFTTRDPRTLPAVARPTFTTSPIAQTLTAGQALQLTASALGTPPPTFQWMRDGVAISGATGATYRVAAVDESHAGRYTVVATNAGGSTTSAAATITVMASRIINLSILSAVSAASPDLTVGFVAAGASKTLLVRAVGPTLTRFGVVGPLARPGLNLYAGQSPLASNEGWDRALNAAQIATTATRVGAFDLPAASTDAAVLQSFGTGNHSAVVQSRGTSPAGWVLVEIYDADSAGGAGRLINVSALAPIGTSGNSQLVAGFVLAGNMSKRLLIRAIGPGLVGFGRAGVLSDPQLEVIRVGLPTPVAANDNWDGDATLATTFKAVGAFDLATASKDAALIFSAEPGAYTVQVTGVNGAAGDALVEIYEIP